MGQGTEWLRTPPKQQIVNLLREIVGAMLQRPRQEAGRSRTIHLIGWKGIVAVTDGDDDRPDALFSLNPAMRFDCLVHGINSIDN